MRAALETYKLKLRFSMRINLLNNSNVTNYEKCNRKIIHVKHTITLPIWIIGVTPTKKTMKHRGAIPMEQEQLRMADFEVDE
jgi:hypothetical protein